MKNYYITTAIPYANAAPHIGTAMDYLYGDILLRYQGDNALMSIGTDEHGSKIAQKAADNNQTPQEFVDGLQSEFENMRTLMNLNFDKIVNVRTTDSDHVRRVQEIWRKLDAAGVIYKSTYEGWYCVGCEAFLTETEAKAMNYTCPDHNRPLEKLSEDNYYLKVSQFTDQIREFAANNIVPAWRGKEILELIKNGAQDVSISRPKEKLSWGVPVPSDENQIMYVWIDALSNYITVLGYPDKDWKQDFWPASVQIIGKDILRFHAIIWPAILLALGVELPKKLLAHGFINVDGAKMSKSLGNVVSPTEIIENYGADAFRYYFSRHIPTFDDGDFTWEKFEAAYNGELANDLGNLVSRVANMIKKYQGGCIAHCFKIQDLGVYWSSSYNQNMSLFDFTKALDEVWKTIKIKNQYIEESMPWNVYKLVSNPSLTDEEIGKILPHNMIWRDDALSDPKSFVHKVLETLVTHLISISIELTPFLPETAAKIRDIFGGEKLPDEIPILFPKKYLHTQEPTRK